MVLKVLRDETFDPRGKMKPRWFGPFIIKKIMLGGATRIVDLDGKRCFTQSTWIDSGNTMFEKEKKRKEKKRKRLLG